MPSVHVFPGGRVEAGDQVIGDGLPADFRARVSRQFDGPVAPEKAMAFYVAAIRETAEECGVLLARDREYHYPPAVIAEAIFKALGGGIRFADLLSAHDLTPDVAALRSFGWWITPDFEPRRYDTRFFIASSPDGHRATYDNVETTDGVWLSPHQALVSFREGTIALAPPTMATLEILAAAETPAAALDSVPRPIRAIRPHLINTDDGEKILVLPGDEAYPNREAPALPERTRFRVLGEGLFI